MLEVSTAERLLAHLERGAFHPVSFAKTKNAFEMIGMREACNIVTRTTFQGVAEFGRTTSTKITENS